MEEHTADNRRQDGHDEYDPSEALATWRDAPKVATPARDEPSSVRRRLGFAVFFALVPNAIAFLIAVGFQSPLAVTYFLSIPGVLVGFPTASGELGSTGMVLNVLLDGGMAYLLTGLRNRGLGLAILVAYVLVSRFIAFGWLGEFVAAST